jgi:hypothetical protein
MFQIFGFIALVFSGIFFLLIAISGANHVATVSFFFGLLGVLLMFFGLLGLGGLYKTKIKISKSDQKN